MISEPYSTDISIAWKIVRKLNADGFEFEFKTETTNLGTKVSARFFKGKERYKIDWSNSDSAPHAICLAGLKAVGIDLPVRE